MKLGFGYELSSTRYQDIEVSMDDLLRSTYIVASSQAGKSSLIETMIAQCAREGIGFGLLDPENRLVPRAVRHLCDAGVKPLVIDPTVTDFVVPMNVLSVPPGIHPHTVVENVLQAFRRAWPDAWGPRLEDFLRHALLLLMEQELTLAELPLLLSNKSFRERVTDASQDPRVRLYFEDHLGKVSTNRYLEWIESTRNKIGALMSNPFIAAPLSAHACVDFLPLMDAGVPIVVNVPESVLGDSGRLFAMLAITRFYQAALRRPPGARPYLLFADEFQTFATRSFLDLGTRGAKRGIGVVIAHQSIKQPPFDSSPEYVDTLLGNTRVNIVMQVGRADAERFAKEIFGATGTQAKRRKKHWLWGDFGDPQFYSVTEEREHQCRELEEQRPREYFVKIRSAKGFKVYCAEAYEVPDPVATDCEAAALSQASLEEHGVALADVMAAQAERLARFSVRRRRAVDNEA